MLFVFSNFQLVHHRIDSFIVFNITRYWLPCPVTFSIDSSAFMLSRLLNLMPLRAILPNEPS
uniref:Uncharacterized protein n=1 Tax=Glossina palpalis gambiensis TaxID=67801 RepID=A0A1B0AYJ3_9MUSC